MTSYAPSYVYLITFYFKHKNGLKTIIALNYLSIRAIWQIFGVLDIDELRVFTFRNPYYKRVNDVS
jgi:hypothetical protein